MTNRVRSRVIDWEVEQAIPSLFVQGRNRGEPHLAAYIGRELRKVKDFEGRIPDKRTLQRVVQDMRGNIKAQPENIQALDEPFEWHRMDRSGLGIPWEGSNYLLEMWAWVREGGPYPRKVTFLTQPSMREIRWWWRIHQADPDAPMKDVWAMAQHFTAREMAFDYLNAPADFGDLQAVVAYKPWQSTEKLRVYLDAVAEGRIPGNRYLSPEAATQLMQELPSEYQDRFFLSIMMAQGPLWSPEEDTE